MRAQVIVKTKGSVDRTPRGRSRDVVLVGASAGSGWRRSHQATSWLRLYDTVIQ